MITKASRTSIEPWIKRRGQRREDALPTRTRPAGYTRCQAIADGQLVDVTDAAHKVSSDIILPTVITDTAWEALRGSQRSKPRADYLRVLKALQAARTAVLGRLPELGRTPFDIGIGRRSHRFAIEVHESDDDGQLGATIMIDRGRGS